VDVLWQCPDDAVAVLVLAHGAGAGMRHAHMQAIADALERRGIGTLRFNFPFIEAGRRRVDPPAVATARVAAAFVLAATRTALPVWLGGHSFGGRMAAQAVLDRQLAPAGLVFCSFPLHAAGKPDDRRGQPLAALRLPSLFLSGTRDALASPALLEPLVRSLPCAKLHWLETADHGYRVLKRTRGGVPTVFDEMAGVAREFVAAHAERDCPA